jgi:hypothetical protein
MKQKMCDNRLNWQWRVQLLFCETFWWRSYTLVRGFNAKEREETGIWKSVLGVKANSRVCEGYGFHCLFLFSYEFPKANIFLLFLYMINWIMLKTDAVEKTCHSACPPQIPHHLILDQTWATAEGSQWKTMLIVAQSTYYLSTNSLYVKCWILSQSLAPLVYKQSKIWFSQWWS